MIDIVRQINKHGKLPAESLARPKNLDTYLPGLYFTKNGKVKSKHASMIVDLRVQYGAFCCDVTVEDLIHNECIGYEDGENQYRWNFAHRHGFPSNVNSAGRGQSVKITDITNHPLSYFLLSFEHHKEYDIYNGEWRNPKNTRHTKEKL